MITNTIKFESFHIADLKAGSYRLEASLAITVGSNYETFMAEQDFYVGAERYTLNPQEIYAVYPPKAANGSYDNVLPHIELTRSTLPWERIALASDDKVPWLGLILIHENELNTEAEVRIQPWNESFAKLGLTAEPGDQEDTQNVSLIYAKPDWLEKIRPSHEDLKWLSHVRMGDSDTGEPFERAMLVCNRLPKPGVRSYVHLVSFENMEASKTQDAEGRMPLLSLYSWEFTCANTTRSRSQGAFKELLDKLEAGMLRTAADKNNAKLEQTLVKIGSLPLAHKLRRGGKTVSWYHGPLVPAEGISTSLSRTLNLPVRHADELLLYDAETAMLDVSYSAAWELGRLLTIGNTSLALKLQEWKLAHAHKLAQDEEKIVFSHLQPFLESEYASTTSSSTSQTLQDYFEGLNLLKGVPFHYLVPDESYLPNESIRFFQVDPYWIEALLDGAFSPGRTTQLDLKREQQHWRPPSETAHPVLSGILLRSELVAGWPALQVDGFDERVTSKAFIAEKRELDSITGEEADDSKAKLQRNQISAKIKELINKSASLSDDLTLSPEGPGSWQIVDNKRHEYYRVEVEADGGLKIYDEDQMPTLRMERLSPNVLLCLFKGIVKTLDIHLPAESLHFGFIKEDNRVFKELKGLIDGKEIIENDKNIIQEIVWRDIALLTVDMANTATQIGQHPKVKATFTGEFGSSHLAVEMIEGVPKMRYTLGVRDSR